MLCSARVVPGMHLLAFIIWAHSRSYESLSFVLSPPFSTMLLMNRRPLIHKSFAFHDDYDENEIIEKEGDDDKNHSSDWMRAEFTLLNAPTEPDPSLDAETVAILCCRSLQFVDHPTKLAGLKRCFSFFTFECRKTVTGRQGGSTPERFCEYGLLSPQLQPFMGAYQLNMGNATCTPANPPHRGEIASFPVEIRGAQVLALQHMSGMNRTGVASPPITNMVLRLERERRPPNQGCWLVREIMDVDHFFAGDMGNAHVGG